MTDRRMTSEKKRWKNVCAEDARKWRKNVKKVFDYFSGIYGTFN